MTAPRFEIVRTDAGWHVRFVAANGEPVLSSEVYTRREAAAEAIDVMVQAVQHDTLNDLSIETFEVDERLTLDIDPDDIQAADS